MNNLSLSQDEVIVLGNYFKHSPIALIRVKAQVMLMRSIGLAEAQIARLVVKNIRSVARYIKDFNETRLASLFSGHVHNENASKLSRTQKEQIRKTLLKPAEEGGLPAQFWNVPKLKEYVKAEFGVVYESEGSYHYLLKFSGLSFNYPDKRSPSRDEEFIERRMQEIRAEITPFLQDRSWIVLACDETRLQLEAEIRRAWLARGKRTVVKTEKNKVHQNYIGFLNQQDGKCQMFEIQRGNQIEIIRILKQLLRQYKSKKVCIVWDNAKWHKGKLLKRSLRLAENFKVSTSSTSRSMRLKRIRLSMFGNLPKAKYQI